MKVLIDASSINKKNTLASIPIFILRLIDAFIAHSPCDVALLIDADFKDYFEKKYPSILKYTVKRNFVLYRLPIIGSIYGRNVYRKSIRNINCDIGIIASDLDRSTRIKTTFKRIQVLFDLKAVKDGSFFQKYRNKLFYDFIIKSADAIVVSSNYTKTDVLRTFSVPPRKIKVIPCSVEPLTIRNVPNIDCPSKFILYVNTLLPHKNAITLIKAFEKIQKTNDVDLVLVGKETSYWKKVLLPYIRNHNLGSRIFLFQNLTRDELQFLYNKSSLFVTPSLREGFGYTPIEAALSRIPVISSTCEALPDSTQNLLNYYSPAKDYNALAKKITEILSSPPSQEHLNAIAAKYTEDYSPQKQVERFMIVFSQIQSSQSDTI